MFRDAKVYLWGAILGLVVIFAFATARPVGTATVYEKVAGHIIEFFAPEYVYRTVHYYQKAVPVAEWETMFVIGLFGAGLLARYVLPKKRGAPGATKAVPDLWAARFGPDRKKRFLASFVGGAALLFGARLANGCTSGHFISGGSQLAVSAYIFAVSMFIAGAATAAILYRRKESAVDG